MSQHSENFSVVLFVKENKVEAVPSSWLQGTTRVFWPPFKDTAKVSRAIVKSISPEIGWQIYDIKLIKTCGK